MALGCHTTWNATFVGYSVWAGNGNAVKHEIANFITPTTDEDGVAHAIQITWNWKGEWSWNTQNFQLDRFNNHVKANTRSRESLQPPKYPITSWFCNKRLIPEMKQPFKTSTIYQTAMLLEHFQPRSGFTLQIDLLHMDTADFNAVEKCS